MQWSALVEQVVNELADTDYFDPKTPVKEGEYIVGEIVDGRVRLLFCAFNKIMAEGTAILQKEGISPQWRDKIGVVGDLAETMSASLREICGDAYKNHVLLIRKDWKIVIKRGGSLN